MAVSEQQLQQAVNVAAASSQACAASQVACERAVEQVMAWINELRAWEKRPRQVLKEIVREVQSDQVANLPAVIEQQPVDLSPVTDAIDRHAARVEAMEQAIGELQRRQTRLVPVPQAPSVSEERVAALEAQLAKLSANQANSGAVVSFSEATILDRLAAVEDLVVEGMQAPKALSEHLKLMADIMDAMQRRVDAMRDVDEQQRQIAEQSAMAQGGLAAAVQSLRADLDTVTSVVASIRNQLAARDDYRTRIISRGR